MIVGTDNVHMKEYPCINKRFSEKITQKSETIYLPGKYIRYFYFNILFNYVCIYIYKIKMIYF